MNAKRRQSIINGLTAVARKVLECVPKQEPMDQHKILAEYQRLHGSIAFRVLQGALHNLVESKLIKIKGSCFIQDSIQDNVNDPDDDPDLYPETEIEKPMNNPIVPVKKPVVVSQADPTSEMSRIAERLRTMGEQMTQLATMVEDAALLYEEKLDKIGADTEKLRQLQALLKSLG